MSNSSMLKYLVVCLVLIYSVQSRTSPLGKEKEGFCPPTSGAGICVERCNNDQSCPGRQKCCSNGCGHVCMHPTGGIKPSPAKCPKGKPLPNVFCGRGPTRQHCPQGYSCNVEPTDGFAVCCPDDNSATKCPKGKPLPNVFCGRGPARKDCPQGYSCNIEPTDGFAVCCPDDNRATPVCGPVCAIFCKFGNVLDNKGCPTCNCRTGCQNEAKPLASVTCGSGSQRCPGGYKCSSPPSGGAGVCCRRAPVCGPVCAIFCKFGNVLDNKGCPTCNCRTGCKNEAKPLASVRCGSGGQKCPGRYECSSPPSGGAGVCCEKECPLIKCPIPCPFGSVTVNGCPTCKCKPGCEKGNPLKNIQCGLGPGSQTCPQGYYCNSNGNNAVCCQIPCKHGKPHPTLSCGQFVGSNKCPAGYSCLGHPADAYFACCPDEKECPLIKCPIPCPFGSVTVNGCPTCKCKPDPCQPPPCARPPPNVCTEPKYRIIDGVKCPWCYKIVPCKPKCHAGIPLPKINCGRGVNREDCPSGFSCNTDPLDKFAVCCPQCDRGIALANTRCGNHTEKCPSGYQCKYKYGICCPELKLCLHCCGPPPCCNTCGLPPPPPQKCPADPRPNATCHHFIKNCKDDSSCPKQKKCCKRRCTYKCLKAV